MTVSFSFQEVCQPGEFMKYDEHYLMVPGKQSILHLLS